MKLPWKVVFWSGKSPSFTTLSGNPIKIESKFENENWELKKKKDLKPEQNFVN